MGIFTSFPIFHYNNSAIATLLIKLMDLLQIAKSFTCIS